MSGYINPGGPTPSAAPDAWERNYRDKLAQRFRGGRGGGSSSRMGDIVVDSLVIGAVAAVLGAIVWQFVSPDVMAEATENGARMGIAEARREFGVEVAFVAVTAAAGVIAGAVLMLRHRDDPVSAQVAAAVTGVLGALAVWQLGLRMFGPTDLAVRAAVADPGTPLEVQLDVSSFATFVAWPVAALIAGAVVMAIRDRPSQSRGVEPAIAGGAGS